MDAVSRRQRAHEAARHGSPPAPFALLLALQTAPASAIVPADTAWMLVSTALVLLMTPAVGFFYGGLVRAKNALNTMMMCLGSLATVGVLWALIGYTLAFGGT